MDMLTFALEVQSFVKGKTWDEYESDIQFRRAVERSVELIGEAARKISNEFEADHPEIPWNKIIVQRHRIAHEYDRLDDGIIWSVAMKYVPELIGQIQSILPQPPQIADENTP
jgi:uncharacterized protein with HEPN domain